MSFDCVKYKIMEIELEIDDNINENFILHNYSTINRILFGIYNLIYDSPNKK